MIALSKRKIDKFDLKHNYIYIIMEDVNSAFNDTKIDYRVLVAIVGTVILFQVYLECFVPESILDDFISFILIPSSFLTGFASFWVAKKHGTSKFAVAFYSLGFGFFSVCIAEILYYHFDMIGINPYPSIADLFYVLLYPFAMIHLLININFYQEKGTLRSKIGVTSFAVLMVLVYTCLSFLYTDMFSIDFFYGLIFVIGAASITSVGIYGVIVVRKIPLGRSWFVLVAGLVTGTMADMWYYGLELVDAYTLDHIVNLFWYASYLILIYALYKHSKIM